MIWKPSLNSATCFCENISKISLSDHTITIAIDDLETILEFRNLLLREHIEDIARGLRLSLLRGGLGSLGRHGGEFTNDTASGNALVAEQ